MPKPASLTGQQVDPVTRYEALLTEATVAGPLLPDKALALEKAAQDRLRFQESLQSLGLLTDFEACAPEERGRWLEEHRQAQGFSQVGTAGPVQPELGFDTSTPSERLASLALASFGASREDVYQAVLRHWPLSDENLRAVFAECSPLGLGEVSIRPLADGLKGMSLSSLPKTAANFLAQFPLPGFPTRDDPPDWNARFKSVATRDDGSTIGIYGQLEAMDEVSRGGGPVAYAQRLLGKAPASAQDGAKRAAVLTYLKVFAEETSNAGLEQQVDLLVARHRIETAVAGLEGPLGSSVSGNKGGPVTLVPTVDAYFAQLLADTAKSSPEAHREVLQALRDITSEGQREEILAHAPRVGQAIVDQWGEQLYQHSFRDVNSDALISIAPLLKLFHEVDHGTEPFVLPGTPPLVSNLILMVGQDVLVTRLGSPTPKRETIKFVVPSDPNVQGANPRIGFETSVEPLERLGSIFPYGALLSGGAPVFDLSRDQLAPTSLPGGPVEQGLAEYAAQKDRAGEVPGIVRALIVGPAPGTEDARALEAFLEEFVTKRGGAVDPARPAGWLASQIDSALLEQIQTSFRAIESLPESPERHWARWVATAVLDSAVVEAMAREGKAPALTSALLNHALHVPVSPGSARPADFGERMRPVPEKDKQRYAHIVADAIRSGRLFQRLDLPPAVKEALAPLLVRS